jgi:hypothetical protein
VIRTSCRRALTRLLAPLAVATVLVAVPSAAHAASYSAPLMTAIADLPVASEVRTGYDRDLFPHWVDADGDGCHARNEVLIAEADDPVTVGSGCSLSGGRWFSYYDQVSWTQTSDVDIDHMVPLAEAWDSGARTWSTSVRQSYANDLGDYRTLVGVTDNVNQAKSDQDIAEWLPQYDRCRYLREYVAVKHRWGLTVDSAEKQAMNSLGASCTNTTITVTLAR